MMANFIMVYTSMTGNTKAMADGLAEGIRKAGYDVRMEESDDFDAKELENYDGILVGTYTWGGGELPDEMLDFYEDLENVNLSGKKAIVFGSFDSIYGDNGIAVDIMMEQLKKQGAELIYEGFKIELDPDPDELENCRIVGKWFAETVDTLVK